MCKRSRFVLFALELMIIPFSNVLAQGEEVPLPKSLQVKQSKVGNGLERNYNWMVGGNVGFSISSVISTELMPQVGIYPFKDWLLVGVNACYMFAYDFAYKNFQHVFGGGFFVEGYPIKWLTLHVGYEYINYPQISTLNGMLYTDRVGSHAVLVGPGYRQSITEKWGLYGLALFNVYQYDDAYYNGYIPIVRLGFFVKL